MCVCECVIKMARCNLLHGNVSGQLLLYMKLLKRLCFAVVVAVVIAVIYFIVLRSRQLHTHIHMYIHTRRHVMKCEKAFLFTPKIVAYFFYYEEMNFN